MTDQKVQRKLAAILYADVADYSRLTGEDELRTHQKLGEHLDILTGSIEEHNGRVVHFAGDAILSEFSSVVDALTAAIVAQRVIGDKNNQEAEGQRLQFRIGINLGEVIVDRDDIFGDGVNVAARLENLSVIKTFGTIEPVI
ncbi:MAG: adenylate/guanylate cyclase domain-containing protein [Proteobacteria bacterium]|nr:adenylate/guanylate cyclase domain-containing protein [Pseudomonadota bacterium]